jgi:predicted GNAT family acetyltransferase
MGTDVRFTDAPDHVLEDAGPFLQSDPVRHNVILTLLEIRAAYPEPGNYWIVRLDGDVCGVGLQSPTNFFVTVTPMPAVAVTALVDAIVDHGGHVPGINADAATAARFAGQWTERTRSAARPVEGQRIYAVEDVVSPVGVAGHARPAVRDDRDFVVTSYEGFAAETGETGGFPPEMVADHRLRVGQLWVWDDETPVSVAGLSEPVAGVIRVGPVYTPRERRGRGYASALVASLSTAVLARGQQCILYTDLGNATSNALYRAIGYRAVEEALRYHFQSSQ